MEYLILGLKTPRTIPPDPGKADYLYRLYGQQDIVLAIFNRFSLFSFYKYIISYILAKFNYLYFKEVIIFISITFNGGQPGT